MSLRGGRRSNQYERLISELFIDCILLKFDSMEKAKQVFNEAEIELLKEGLRRTYKERFQMTTRLYKIQQTLNKASISHKSFISK